MPVEKRPRLRPPTPEEANAMDHFAAEVGVPPSSLFLNPLVLVIPGGNYSDVFDVPRWVGAVLSSVGAAYSLGYHVGSIERAGKPTFRPSLPLAHRAARLCGLGASCHVVDDFGERVFLYGRVVLEDHIIRASEGLGVVVNSRGEALGWGVVKAKKGELVLAPLSDLGWYLRRGG